MEFIWKAQLVLVWFGAKHRRFLRSTARWCTTGYSSTMRVPLKLTIGSSISCLSFPSLHPRCLSFGAFIRVDTDLSITFIYKQACCFGLGIVVTPTFLWNSSTNTNLPLPLQLCTCPPFPRSDKQTCITP